jgi:hypothetical protein
VLVAGSDKSFDGLNQLRGVLEALAGEGLAAEDAEPNFDLIKP